MTAILPPPLSRGEKVSIIAPAGVPLPESLEAGIARLREVFEPVRYRDAFQGEGYLAGTDAERIFELLQAIDDTSTRALLPVRGGFGTTRIMDEVTLETFARDPKWIVGSSDLTALLIELWHRHRVVTIHGPMVAGYSRTEGSDVEQLVELLQGRPWRPPGGMKGLSGGNAGGPFIGGNLTMIAHLAGTLSPSFSDGAILFLEDVQEKPYRLERYLTQLRRAGILDGVAGMVLGEFTGCEPGPDGTTWPQVMERNLAPMGVPVATGYPAAHGKRNAPFLHGAEVSLRIVGEQVELIPATDRF